MLHRYCYNCEWQLINYFFLFSSSKSTVSLHLIFGKLTLIASVGYFEFSMITVSENNDIIYLSPFNCYTAFLSLSFFLMTTTYSTRFSCSNNNKQLTGLDLEMTSILELSAVLNMLKCFNKDIKCVKESSATDGQHA